MSQASFATDDSTERTVPGRKGRWAELILLIIALAVGLGAYTVIDLTHYGELPDNFVLIAGGITVGVLLLHLVIRFRAPYADPVLLPCVVLLNGLGLALIRRLDIPRLDEAAETGDPPSVFAATQLQWTALGAVVLIAFLFIVRDHRRLQRLTYTSGLIGVILLALPLIPGIGVYYQGAQIWIRLGGIGFQPGEPAKLCLVVFFAGYLVVKRDVLALAGRRFLGLDLPRGRDFWPILLAWLISIGIVVYTRDLGSSLLFFGAFVTLLYISTERPGWLVIGALLFTAGGVFAYSVFSYVQFRFQAWLDPFANIDDFYQVVQAMYGLAYGGILGRGLGEGRPDLIPVAHSDFLPAVLGEELGLTGLMAVIVIYGILIERGLRTALICRDSFGKLLAAGFAIMMGLQVFISIGGVTKLIPLSGMTTPFMSYGGSSLITNWALIALLLRISDYARRPEPPPAIQVDDALTQVVSRR